MKTLFLNATLKDKYTIPPSALKKLPQDIIVACTVQYINSLPGIQRQLEQSGRTIEIFKGIHSTVPGQILGCDLVTVKKPFLFIGDGEFHPLTIAYSSDVDVYCYDPPSKIITIIDRKDVDALKKRRKGAYLKFMHASSIGVIISIKPGQNFLKKALTLQEKFPDKQFTFFLCDALDFSELENYPFVEVWVNTACPRIGWDDLKRLEKPLVNLIDILNSTKDTNSV